MRSISASLLAAQRSASATPYLKVEVLDRRPTVARPFFQRLYTGAEPDSHHAATMPGDGSLVRTRLDPSTGNLYVQRIASPGEGSAFGSWTLLTTGWAGGGVALASRGAQAMLFYVDPNIGRTIYVRESSDYGATWGAPATAINPSERTVGLAADIAPSGLVVLAYAGEDNNLWLAKRSGGVWSTLGAWGYTAQVSVLRGHACVYSSDWCLAVCGQASSGENKAWTITYGDGGALPVGAWSSLREVVQASQGASVEFKRPALCVPDVFRLWFVESYTGAGAYSRPIGSFLAPGSAFADNRWREGVPFDLSSTYGVALAHGSGVLWLCTPSGVWRGPISATPLPLTGDVLSAELNEEPGRGHATLALRNDDGRYNVLGSGTLSALRFGSQVAISPGYRTSAGAEASDGPAFWIEGWEHRRQGGRATFHLRLADGWNILEGWRARRQRTWTAGQASVQAILTDVLAAVGMQLVVLNASSTFTTHAPDFTIHPGEDGATAVRCLLTQTPDVLFFRSGVAYVKYLQASGPVDYAYGTSHAILEARYAAEAGRFNRVQAYGQGVTAEAFRWTSVGELHDRLLQLHDRNLGTQAVAQARANALAAQEARRCVNGEVTAPVNCGQELYDLVEVTDAHAGLSAAKRRVLGLRLRYEAGASPRYVHTLSLGGE
ncbi:MAG: hypothetical protein Q8O40_07095 [Chloroflexota bacterium]|nr:hypothetical protein [Chloroflexota bacterium]